MGNFDQIAPNLYNFISYDPLKGLLWNVKCYNGVQLVPFKFFKENPFWGKSGNLGKLWNATWMSWKFCRIEFQITYCMLTTFKIYG